MSDFGWSDPEGPDEAKKDFDSVRWFGIPKLFSDIKKAFSGASGADDKAEINNTHEHDI